MTISKKRLQEIAAIPDEAIDTNDIPEADEEFFKKARWCGTPMLIEEEEDALRTRSTANKKPNPA